MARLEVVQAQEVIEALFILFLSIGMPYYQEGCNLAS
jgi:hypothetical protein